MTDFTFLGALMVYVCGGLLVLLALLVVLMSIHIAISKPSKPPRYMVTRGPGGRGRVFYDPRFTAARASTIRSAEIAGQAGVQR